VVNQLVEGQQMPRRTNRHLVGLAVALAVTIAACGGGATGGRPTEGAAGPTGQLVGTPAGPTSTPITAGGTSAATGANPSTAPASSTSAGGSGSISTEEAARLLSQVDDLLRQLDVELSAHDDAAINQGE